MDALFASLDMKEPYYDAYDKDFAVAHFFFNSPTALEFVKTVILIHYHSILDIKLTKSFSPSYSHV